MQKLTQTYLLLTRGQPAQHFKNFKYNPSLAGQVPKRFFWNGQKQKQPDPNAFDPSIDYYKVLEVKKSATDKEIKNMYYKKCYEYHPDRTGGMH